MERSKSKNSRRVSNFLTPRFTNELNEAVFKKKKEFLGLTILYNYPKDAVADLIFIYNIKKDSRKTWTKNTDPALFWP